MIYSIILFILFSFVTYRLIGAPISFGKILTASIFSLIFSSALYHTLHLKNQSLEHTLTHFDHYTFLYFITLIIVSLGFSLVLELITKQEEFDDTYEKMNVVDQIRYYFATRFRLLQLLWIISRNGLLSSPLHLDEQMRNEKIAIAFKETLEHAGGIFIKFGQFLSTRSDLLPPAFLVELSKLQENVNPLPEGQVEEIIERELQKPIHELFSSFNTKPIAAASMAQVHRATLHTGEDVVVKALRPSLRKKMAVDVKILLKLAQILSKKTTWASRIGIVDLTHGFITNLYEEVDLSIEFHNTKQMRDQAEKHVYIPKVFAKYSTPNLLTIEFLDGVNVSRIDHIFPNAEEEKEMVITTIFQEMLSDIFDHGLYHADPHPGNILVLKNGRPAFIDFGAVGRLSNIQREGFQWLLIGINRKHPGSMVTGITKLVVNEEMINTKKLEQTLGLFLAKHNFEGDIMDEMGSELFALLETFDLRLYPDVVGAFRSLVTLQGSLQAINPSFNLAQSLELYLKDFMNVKNLANKAIETAEEDFLNVLPKIREFPQRIDRITQQLEGGRFTFRVAFFADKDNRQYVNSALSLLFTGLAGFAFGLLSLGALFLAQSEDPGGYSFLNVFGYSGLGLSVTMLIRVVMQSMRDE